jgi:ATP-dependent DNA helicase RecQ
MHHPTPQEILQQYWGFDQFRPTQEEIIQAVLNGKDSLAILPTGGGKSICFQVPALIKDGTCLVISPLIALMLDQVERLNKLGISAKTIHTGLSADEIEDIINLCEEGDLKFLYVSPERLNSNKFLERLEDLPISMLAVDEAHCISQWGYDFRPAYLHIASVKTYLNNVPIIALTASATPKVKDDIVEKLKLKNPSFFFGSFARENLSYQVVQADDKINFLKKLLIQHPGSSIVYCRTRKRTKEFSDLLQQFQLKADFYHAGLNQEQRTTKQQDWISGKIDCIVCTNAFGMGIDKPDVRLVVHMDVPDCLENYYQEAGRAGRDGKYAAAVLLYRNQELEELKQLPNQKFPGIDVIRKVYKAVCNYFQLPIGSGNGKFFDFDIQAFTTAFKLNLFEVLYCLDILKQEEILTYQDQVFSPSTLMFTTARRTLENFEAEHKNLEPLIKILLRTYGGIFDIPIKINESQIAWLLKWDISNVRESLKKLHQFGITEYHPSKESAQILFQQERIQADELQINYPHYLARKKEYSHRIDYMIKFIQSRECRSIIISDYFGDTQQKTCGICDRCVSISNTAPSKQYISDLLKKIIIEIKKREITFNELLIALNQDEEILKTGIEILEKEGQIISGVDGKFREK